jgi:hypothetical protein
MLPKSVASHITIQARNARLRVGTPFDKHRLPDSQAMDLLFHASPSCLSLQNANAHSHLIPTTDLNTKALAKQSVESASPATHERAIWLSSFKTREKEWRKEYESDGYRSSTNYC